MHGICDPAVLRAMWGCHGRALVQADITAVEIMTGLKNYKNQFLLKRNWK